MRARTIRFPIVRVEFEAGLLRALFETGVVGKMTGTLAVPQSSDCGHFESPTV